MIHYFTYPSVKQLKDKLLKEKTSYIDWTNVLHLEQTNQISSLPMNPVGKSAELTIGSSILSSQLNP